MAEKVIVNDLVQTMRCSIHSGIIWVRNSILVRFLKKFHMGQINSILKDYTSTFTGDFM